MILDWIGPDQTIYGSDAPPLTSLKPRAIELVQELNVTTADKEKSSPAMRGSSSN
jgi:predicted TIM-barrel fold metal-dependent hydrolase